jgi:hypothetical protein
METLITALNFALPLLGIILLLFGVKRGNLTSIIIALWVSLVALLLQYQLAGDEILGTYFDYKNAAIYTINSLILSFALLYILLKASLFHRKYIRYLTGLLAAGFITGGVLLLTNIWINAEFIENRFPGSAIMQVVTFTPPRYCEYRYVFYKVGNDKKISYLCPNHYGLVPAIGHLEVAPDFLFHQLAQQMQHKTSQQQ